MSKKPSPAPGQLALRLPSPQLLGLPRGRHEELIQALADLLLQAAASVQTETPAVPKGGQGNEPQDHR